MRQTVRKKAKPQGSHTLIFGPRPFSSNTLTPAIRIRHALKRAAAADFRVAPRARLALTTPTNPVVRSLPIAPVSASNSTVRFAAASRPSSARWKPRARSASTIPAMTAHRPPAARIAAAPACSWTVGHPSPSPPPRRIRGFSVRVQTLGR